MEHWKPHVTHSAIYFSACTIFHFGYSKTRGSSFKCSKLIVCKTFIPSIHIFIFLQICGCVCDVRTAYIRCTVIYVCLNRVYFRVKPPWPSYQFHILVYPVIHAIHLYFSCHRRSKTKMELSHSQPFLVHMQDSKFICCKYI